MYVNLDIVLTLNSIILTLIHIIFIYLYCIRFLSCYYYYKDRPILTKFKF